MAGTGLKEVMSQVYAKGSVDHMLSGKTVAVAVRAHLLVDSSLNTIATTQMLGIPVPRISYNHAVVVFDGYASGPSSKDVTHQRRASSQNIKP